MIPNFQTPFSSDIFHIPRNTSVFHEKAGNLNDTNIVFEEDTLESIIKIDLDIVEQSGELWEKMDAVKKELAKNHTSEAALLLRTLVMNHLTKFYVTRENGKKRFIKDSLKESKLAQYDEIELEVQEKLLDEINAMVQLNLDVLHKFVKDEKIIKIPDSATISLVYSNLITYLFRSFWSLHPLFLSALPTEQQAIPTRICSSGLPGIPCNLSSGYQGPLVRIFLSSPVCRRDNSVLRM